MSQLGNRPLPKLVLACCTIAAWLLLLQPVVSAASPSETVFSWGDNEVGQLGTGSSAAFAWLPDQVSGSNGDTVAIASGYYHHLALRGDGTVVAWGFNHFGQLGAVTSDSCTLDGGQFPCSRVPLKVGSLSSVTGVAAGNNFSLALTSSGNVYAWGTNYRGELGTELTACRGGCPSSPTPVLVTVAGGQALTNVTRIAAGAYVGMALRSDGSIWTWGSDEWGQLGRPYKQTNQTRRAYAAPVTDANGNVLTGFTTMAAGDEHALALHAPSGLAMAWGTNTYGQLGISSTVGCYTTILCSVPVPVCCYGGFTDIAAGAYHSLAVWGYRVMAWGFNPFGQLGDGTTTSRSTPIFVSTLSGTVNSIAGGATHSLASVDGAVYAWGSNYRGELGAPSFSVCGSGATAKVCSLTPTKVFMSAPMVKAVSANWFTSLALTNACVCP